MPEERTSSTPARGTGTSGGLDGLSLASLEGSRILVVEDEAIIAVDI